MGRWLRLENDAYIPPRVWELRQEGVSLLSRSSDAPEVEHSERFRCTSVCVQQLQLRISELKQAGYRPREEPESHLWRLLEQRGPRAHLLEDVEGDIREGRIDIAESHQGVTLLEHSLRCRNRELAWILIDAGAELAAISRPGVLLFKAIDLRQPELIRALVHAGADVNTFSFQGSLLGYACELGDQSMAERLLELGADPSFGSWHLTPLANAEASGNSELIALIKASLAREAEATTSRRLSHLNDAAHPCLSPCLGLSKKERLERYDPVEVSLRLRVHGTDASFQDALTELEALTMSTAQDHSAGIGGYWCHWRGGDIDDDGLAAMQRHFAERGMFVFRYGKPQSRRTLIAIPTIDPLDSLVMFGTNGSNADIFTPDIIDWLLRCQKDHPFELLAVAGDSVYGRFLQAPENPLAMVERMRELDADSTEDRGSAKLAKDIAETRSLYFWWD